MADKELRVIVTAQDGASRVFTEVGSSAEAAGSSVQRAGEQGSAGAQQLTKSTAELKKEMDDAAKAATLVGGAITSAFVAPMMAGATAAFRQVSAVEQATIALNAYEKDASKVNAVLEELVAFAQSDLGRLFQREELFAAAQALRVAGAETENLTRYVEIMSRSVSTGMATWNDLERVLTRIVSTGRLTTIEFELLQQAGFQLDEELRNTTVTVEELFDALDRGSVEVAGQTETIRGQVTMTMSALRGLGLELLDINEKSQFAAGGLGDTMMNALGQTREGLIALRPVAAATGDALAALAGMASDVVYAFTSLPDGVQSSVLGIVALGGAALTATGSFALVVPRIAALVRNIRNIPAAARLAAASITPMGLAAAGVTAALVAGVAVWGAYRREVEEAKHVIDSLYDSYLDLRVAADQARLAGDEQTEAYLHQMRFQIESVRAEAEAIRFNIPGEFPNLMEMYEAQLEDGIADYRDFITSLQDEYKLTGEQADSLVESQNRLTAAFNDSRVDGQALAADVDALYWSFMRREITLDEFVRQFEELSMSTADYAVAAEEATAATSGLLGVFELIQDEATGFAQTIMQLNTISDDDSFITKFLKSLGVSAGDRANLQSFFNDITAVYSMYEGMPEPGSEHAEWLAWVNEAEQGTYVWRMRVAAANQEMAEQKAALEESNDALDFHNTLLGRTLESQRQDAIERAAMVESYEMLLDHVLETNEAILEITGNATLLGRVSLTSFKNDAIEAAQGLTQAATALDNVFRIVVGNTDAIGNQVNSVYKWAEALIDVQGEYSKLDDLVKAGLITGESGVFDDDSQYARAQQAFNEIQANNEQIQNDILAIQAMQAPLIAGQTSALARHMEEIRLLNDGTTEGMYAQLEALAWMDEGIQGTVLQIMDLHGALQHLGPEGEAAFQQMIDGAIALNPALVPVLETLGYIENVRMNTDGTFEYDVVMSGGEEARSEIEDLTLALNDLVDVLYTIFIDGDGDSANEVIRTVRENVEDLDGETATVEIHLNDYATAGINTAAWALSALDGAVASTTIRTIYESRGIGPGMALGGVVQEYASGGVVIRAGEVGPEIAHFANGGTALLPRDGLYSVPQGTYITPNHAINNSYGGHTFNITVNGADANFVLDVMEHEVIPMIARAAADKRVGMGAS